VHWMGELWEGPTLRAFLRQAAALRKARAQAIQNALEEEAKAAQRSTDSGLFRPSPSSPCLCPSLFFCLSNNVSGYFHHPPWPCLVRAYKNCARSFLRFNFFSWNHY
jgi:hypothetical protein